ncbi:MAG: serine hydrolase [Actinomycetota bacterium]|nr:serine hydrolase [Actinomycetota bacterium]
MTNLGVLQEGRVRRSARQAQRRRRRRRRRLAVAVAVIALGTVTLLAFMAARASGPAREARRLTGPPAQVAHRRISLNRYGAVPSGARVHPRFKTALRSGLLFDVHTGRILWERDPERLLPIASLTKMMTALVVVAHARPEARVLITRQALDFSGSGVGQLPLGHRVSAEALLYGLLLPSGNDAAIALAQHVGGTQGRFVAMMNARAQAMGLGCTHFSTVSGILDRDNRSCATDLARIAHAVLTQPLLSRIVATRDASLPFPIKGGKLYLYNNNPLLRLSFPGTDGVKTGYTAAAGRCLVVAARRGHTWLGAVLLNSADPPGQAEALLNLGFAARGA